jgi:hypothetical protein
MCHLLGLQENMHWLEGYIKVIHKVLRIVGYNLNFGWRGLWTQKCMMSICQKEKSDNEISFCSLIQDSPSLVLHCEFCNECNESFFIVFMKGFSCCVTNWTFWREWRGPILWITFYVHFGKASMNLYRTWQKVW